MKYRLSLTLLMICMIASMMLSIAHFSSSGVFGCGGASPCARLAEGSWGKIPLINWPVAFAGFSYFLSLTIVFVLNKGRSDRFTTIAIRLSGLMSLVFLTVLAVEKIICSYCLTVQVSNLIFVGLCGKNSNQKSGFNLKHTLIFASLIVLSTAILGIAHRIHTKNLNNIEMMKLKASTGEIISTSNSSNGDELLYHPKGGFRGRYSLGSERAKIRIVIFTDFQCASCKQIDRQAMSAFERYPDISISIKHYPMSAVCNDRYKGNDMHPNACWAARAVECAGLLGGNDAFWKMHEWLFDHGGSFTNEEIRNFIQDISLNFDDFSKWMNDPQTLKGIQDDIQEGVELGLYSTPMVFINGVELKGIGAPDALMSAIHTLSLQSLPLQSADADRPPLAIRKHYEDWKEVFSQEIPEAERPHGFGPENSSVRIVIFGDYQEKFTRIADQAARNLVQKSNRIWYSFRNYPFDTSCNGNLKKTIFQGSCELAAAAEAVLFLKDPSKFWRIHEQLMNLSGKPSSEFYAKIRNELEIDPRDFASALDSVEVKNALSADIETGKALGIKSIPAVFINGKLLPRTIIDDRSVIPVIVEQLQNEQLRIDLKN